MDIRILRGHDVKEANQLIKNIYLSCYENQYSQKDIDEFLMFYEDEHILTMMKNKELIMIGAYTDKLVGVIGIQNLNHIQCLYIDKEYQYINIGTELLNLVKKLVKDKVSVYAHLDVIDFFKKNGFIQVSQDIKNHCVKMEYECIYQYHFKDYEEVDAFIASQKDRVYALDNFKRFMNDLCNPQTLLKSVHIGGTNGKGSTTNYIRSVLQKDGYKVATFTSPALTSRLDIMRINDISIPSHIFVEYASRYMSLCLDYELSKFEIEVFIAVMYFIENKVDFALFEVGLGGELDATNIITPLITVNTNIGLDHTEYLGSTYEDIAKTKGGIIKTHVPFVTGEKKGSCIHIFQDICNKHQSLFMQVEDIINIQDTQNQVSYDYRNYHIVLNTTARYQSDNSALAIEVLLYLKEQGYIELDDQVLLDGLKEASWAGRFETLSTNPLIIIDGAHNKEGIEAFYQSAKKYQNIKIIFSALRDKDTHAMLEKLLQLTNDVTVCEFQFYRAQSAIKLAEDFPVHIEKDWKKAIDDSLNHQGVLFVTGSLYFISQARPYILEKLKLSS